MKNKRFSILNMILVLLLFSGIVLDLDNLALYTFVGRVAIFDMIAILYISGYLITGRKIRKKAFINKIFLVIMIFSIYILFSGLIVSQLESVAATGALSYAFKYSIYSLLVLTIVNQLNSDERYLTGYVDTWILFSIVVLFIGVFQILAVNGVPFFSRYFLWENIRGGGARIASTFRWQGPLVLFIGLSVPLIIGKIIYTTSKFKQNMYILLIMGLFVVGIFSGSRSFLLMLPSIALIPVVKFFSQKRFVLKLRHLIFISLPIFLAYQFSETLLSSSAVIRLFGLDGAIGVASEFSHDPRIRIIRSGFEVWRNTPYLGIGSSNMHILVGDASHNTYVEVLFENGLIGFSLYLLFSIFLFRICWTLFKDGFKNRNYHNIVVVSSLLNVYIYQFTASAIQYRIFWSFLPILITTHYFNTKKNSVTNDNRQKGS
ncbi:O-antigen ligase family protein [Marinilactibacillus sp. GCM10026970]|uniref:O-antigen ligase family protein n=1 Tax=Marinilactibacillus sp. GCM10026970 TaxID=3252642 RepID=UPI003614BA34